MNTSPSDTIRPGFIVDHNVGKLAKLLRLLGYDTVFFTGQNDSEMVQIALKENRILLTRDTHILKRKLVTSGLVRASLIQNDNIEYQIRQVVESFNLKDRSGLFTLCMECNRPLETIDKEGIQSRVPPYVWQTQKEYCECPQCHRLYWKGTHWDAMCRRVEKILKKS
jgi:uncharacterized protein with PIN domain